MGLRLTLFRSPLSRLCGCGATSSRMAAPSAQRGQPSLVPPLAVRAGVDAQPAPAGPQGEPAGEQDVHSKRQKRERREKRLPPPRPTHFLALQVSHHPQACAAISQVHASLAQHAPHLKKACVEAASAHLTLGVMALGSEADRTRADEVLAALADTLAEGQLLAPVEIELEGLSHFKHQVLYLDLKQGPGRDRLMQLAAATRSHFQAAGLLLEADRPFVPHITIAKTSKLQGGWGGGRGDGRGGGWGHGRGRKHGHGRGSAADWREERASKQARLGAEQAAEEGVGMQAGDWEGEAAGGPGEASGRPAAAEAPAAAAAAAALAPETGPGQPPAQQQAQQQQAGQAGQTQQAPSSWRRIPADSWAAHAGISGGTATLAELQLCAMQGRRPGEYYKIIASLPLTAQAAPDDGGGNAGGSGGGGGEQASVQGPPGGSSEQGASGQQPL